MGQEGLEPKVQGGARECGGVLQLGEGWTERWARRKQAPKTRRASEVVALTKRRKRDGFVARAAERRSQNAGQTDATQSG